MRYKSPAVPRRSWRLALALTLAGLALGGCNTTRQVDVTDSIPNDYRLRHPISIQEADRSPICSSAPHAAASKRSSRRRSCAFAQNWRNEATGGNHRRRAERHRECSAPRPMPMREIKSIFGAAGVPPRSVAVRPYRPVSEVQLATIKLRYPKIIASAGPSRHVAGGSPARPGATLIYNREPPAFEFRLLQPAQPCRDGRQSGRSRAAARRGIAPIPAAACLLTRHIEKAELTA